MTASSTYEPLEAVADDPIEATPLTTLVSDATITINDSSDIIEGTTGKDIIYNYFDPDGAVVVGVNGLDGDDLIINFANGGVLYGAEGNDRIIAGNGGDSLSGGSGNDVLIGGSGNDILIGGTEDDVLQGGGGADTFYLFADISLNGGETVNHGTDIITDFNASEGDVIILDAEVSFQLLGQTIPLGSAWVQSMISFDSDSGELSLAGQTIAILNGVDSFDTISIQWR